MHCELIIEHFVLQEVVHLMPIVICPLGVFVVDTKTAFTVQTIAFPAPSLRWKHVARAAGNIRDFHRDAWHYVQLVVF